MSWLSDTVAWLSDGANWAGPDGAAHLLGEHLRLSAVSLLVAAVLRVLVTDEQAGLIQIRGPGMDAFLHRHLGIVVIAVGLTIHRGPLSR